MRALTVSVFFIFSCASAPPSSQSALGIVPSAATPPTQVPANLAVEALPQPEASKQAMLESAHDSTTKLLRNKDDNALAIKKLCGEIQRLFKRNLWNKEVGCENFSFEVFGYSHEGRPLLSYEAGDPASKKLTLIQCAIHGDELPSLPMCFRLIQEIENKKRSVPKDTRIVIQPLLNPDGMLRAKPQRMNARGIDINRNFPTADWATKALSAWRQKEKATPRKFPGHESKSESETLAIVDFIESEKPQKIISIHTPLGFLDLDAHGGADQKRRAKFLAINMSKNSGNYTFRTFGFYPGSLGNYAGQERQIPVYTLELPPGEKSATIDNYWKKFRIALWRAIDFDLETGQFRED